MRCDQSSEKDISVAFETLSIISSDLSSQTKNNNQNRPPLQSKILSAMHKIRKSKNRADVDVITKKKKKKNKTSATSFDEGCIAVNISQLLENKIITNVKTPRILFALPPQKLHAKIIYLFRWKILC